MAQNSNVETVSRVIPAPAETIFDLIADPQRHRDFDGSGTVRAAARGSHRLKLGSRFGMAMRMRLPYSMVNTVIEFEENRLLAWETRAPAFLGRLIGGRVWRFTLEPVPEGTRVSESWDISGEGSLTRAAARRMAALTRRNMSATLERIEHLVTG